MVLNLLKKDIDTLSCTALVVFSKTSQKDKSVKVTHAESAKRLKHVIEEEVITGKHLEHQTYREFNLGGFRHLIIIGLGEDGKITHECVRQAAAQAYDSIKHTGAKEVAIHFDGLTTNKKQAPSFMTAFAEGMILAAYQFEELKSKPTPKKGIKEEKSLVHVVSSLAADAAVKKAFQEGISVAETVNFSRTLGDLPGNMMTPEILAEKTVKAAKGLPLKVTVWDKARLEKEKMGGILGVSHGSGHAPRMIIMEYKGAAASKKPVAFVGKGLTFDSGGISIKPSASMEEMKYDMCGGANVIGTMLAIAKLKLKINAIGIVPATENMPGPFATKPGDVLYARNGKSFEVNNTDAEGRIILSDALCYATEQKPQVIIDAATLTGAIVVALGNLHTGYFTRNDALNKKILAASEASGEWTWRMPLTDFHVKDMKGTYADLSNMSSGKGAGSATGAAFLEQFVGEDIPWAHFDIAGTAWAVGHRVNYCPKKGASGVMIRTFVELAKQYA